MNKTVVKVFMVIGILVLVFLAWNIIFSDGGILKTAYNEVVEGVNGQWEKIAGDGSELLPSWGDADNGADDGDGGFDIDID